MQKSEAARVGGPGDGLRGNLGWCWWRSISNRDLPSLLPACRPHDKRLCHSRVPGLLNHHLLHRERCPCTVLSCPASLCLRLHACTTRVSKASSAQRSAQLLAVTPKIAGHPPCMPAGRVGHVLQDLAGHPQHPGLQVGQAGYACAEGKPRLTSLPPAASSEPPTQPYFPSLLSAECSSPMPSTA